MLKFFLYDRLLLMQCSKLISSTRYLKGYENYCMMLGFATPIYFVFPIDFSICATPEYMHLDGLQVENFDKTSTHAKLKLTIPIEPDFETTYRAQRIR